MIEMIFWRLWILFYRVLLFLAHEIGHFNPCIVQFVEVFDYFGFFLSQLVRLFFLNFSVKWLNYLWLALLFSVVDNLLFSFFLVTLVVVFLLLLFKVFLLLNQFLNMSTEFAISHDKSASSLRPESGVTFSTNDSSHEVILQSFIIGESDADWLRLGCSFGKSKLAEHIRSPAIEFCFLDTGFHKCTNSIEQSFSLVWFLSHSECLSQEFFVCVHYIKSRDIFNSNQLAYFPEFCAGEPIRKTLTIPFQNRRDILSNKRKGVNEATRNECDLLIFETSLSDLFKFHISFEILSEVSSEDLSIIQKNISEIIATYYLFDCLIFSFFQPSDLVYF